MRWDHVLLNYWEGKGEGGRGDIRVKQLGYKSVFIWNLSSGPSYRKQLRNNEMSIC
jgi:hypothetical protein